MSIADIDRNPIALSLFPVVEESAGSELALEKARFTENVAGGTAAIVARVVEDGMSATVFVGLVEKAVGSGDCELHFFRSEQGSTSLAVLLQVDGPHEFFFMLDGAFRPLLIPSTTHENEAGEKQEEHVFH